jgi:hypothetical protein
MRSPDSDCLVGCVLLSVVALAETRGKSLKRAEAEIRRINYAEAEKIYRRLLEKDQNR